MEESYRFIRNPAEGLYRIPHLRIKWNASPSLLPFFRHDKKASDMALFKIFLFLKLWKRLVWKEEAKRLLRRDFPEGDELQHNLAQIDAGALLFGIMRIRHVMLLRDEKVLLFLNAFRGIIFQLTFLILGVLFIIQHTHMFVKILRIWKIEVYPISTSLRVQRIIVRILYAQQIEQEGKNELALGVASRTVEEHVLFDNFSDAGLLCMLKAGEGIADIAAIVEGKCLIFRFELTQTRLQLLAF